MEPSELLVYLAGKLDELHLPYLVTGSTVTIFYGEPRITNDLDVVLKLPSTRIAALHRAFPETEFYIRHEAMVDAVANYGQFNIIHPNSGLKIDVMIADDSPFNRSRLQRRRRQRVSADLDVFMSSAEDAIIKKLEYYKHGGSEKHLRDITGVLRVQGTQLDRFYIEIWVARLDLAREWEAVVRRTG
jgi:hypothetical protein